MSWWRIGLFVYLLIGAALILWRSRLWWREMERYTRQMLETMNGGWGARIVVAIVVLISFTLDIVNWPRCAWRLFKFRNVSKS